MALAAGSSADGPVESPSERLDADGAAASMQTDASDDASDAPTIEYLNCTAVRVNGADTADVSSASYGFSSGLGTFYGIFDVNGSKVLRAPGDDSGAVITTVTARSGDRRVSKENPNQDDCLNTTRPERPTLSVESVESNGDGSYEVTFGYENSNGIELALDSTFEGEEVDEPAPTSLRSGEHTFTRTWTPPNDSATLVWNVSLGSHGYEKPVSVTVEQPEEDSNGTTDDAAYYQVDLVTGEPWETIGGSDGRFYADENRLVRFAHGSSEDGITEVGSAWAKERIRNCVDAGAVRGDDGTVSMRFTVAEGCQVELSLAAYEKPDSGFSREMTQELFASTTDTYGPGTHTVSVDVPGESSDDTTATTTTTDSNGVGDADGSSETSGNDGSSETTVGSDDGSAGSANDDGSAEAATDEPAAVATTTTTEETDGPSEEPTTAANGTTVAEDDRAVEGGSETATAGSAERAVSDTTALSWTVGSVGGGTGLTGIGVLLTLLVGGILVATRE